MNVDIGEDELYGGRAGRETKDREDVLKKRQTIE